jgi:hypothetical protein
MAAMQRVWAAKGKLNGNLVNVSKTRGKRYGRVEILKWGSGNFAATLPGREAPHASGSSQLPVRSSWFLNLRHQKPCDSAAAAARARAPGDRVSLAPGKFSLAPRCSCMLLSSRFWSCPLIPDSPSRPRRIDRRQLGRHNP